MTSIFTITDSLLLCSVQYGVPLCTIKTLLPYPLSLLLPFCHQVFALCWLWLFSHIGLTYVRVCWWLTSTVLISMWRDVINTDVQQWRPLCHSPNTHTHTRSAAHASVVKLEFVVCASKTCALLSTLRCCVMLKSHCFPCVFFCVSDIFYADMCVLVGLPASLSVLLFNFLNAHTRISDCIAADFDQSHRKYKYVIWWVILCLPTLAYKWPVHLVTGCNIEGLNIDFYWWPLKEGWFCGGNAVAAVRLHVFMTTPRQLRGLNMPSLGLIYFML